MRSVSVKISCTLKTFCSLARKINNDVVLKRKSPHCDQVHSIPSILMHLTNSMASATLEIVVNSFADIASILGIKDDDDYKT